VLFFIIEAEVRREMVRFAVEVLKLEEAQTQTETQTNLLRQFDRQGGAVRGTRSLTTSRLVLRTMRGWPE
jgi:hypothetical protein